MIIILGRKDKIDFPELGFKNVDVKVDTGAYTSTIHAHSIEETIVDKQPCLKFVLLDPTHPSYTGEEHTTHNYDKKIVKSSNGIGEERFVVRTLAVLFGQTYKISLTLSERSEMRFPILLGRKFLTKKFLIDTSKTNLSFKSKKSDS